MSLVLDMWFFWGIDEIFKRWTLSASWQFREEIGKGDKYLLASHNYLGIRGNGWQKEHRGKEHEERMSFVESLHQKVCGGSFE